MPGLTEAAFAALDRRLDAASSAPVALGLSGGGDSMALLLIAARWAKTRRRPLLALTVDHRLHPESAVWTAFAGEAAGRVGAAWRALPWLGEKPNTGLPAAARAARHRLLADAAREAGAAVILLAHTADDILEGEVMRDADAPGLGYLREWSPSPVWPEGRGLFLLRPLLEARRQALRGWLDAQGAAWLDDPANDDLTYARARARAALSDRPPTFTIRAAGSEATAGAVAAKGDPSGGLRLPRTAISQDADAARRLLSLLIVCAAGADRPPRGEALDRLHHRIRSENAFVAGLGGARIVADEHEVVALQEAGSFVRSPRQPLCLARGQTAVWDGRFLIHAEADLSVAPLSGFASRLSKIERASLGLLPPAARAVLPVLMIGDEVRLPRPFGGGPATADSLVRARFAAAAGLIRCEGEIKPACEGRSGMAHGLQASYVGDLALA